MEMTDQRWRYTTEYSREVFGQQDRHLAGLMAEATAAGLPDIAVSADVGRLLMMLTAMTRARLALEVGTLGGYSGIWMARGLAEGGRLITIEREPNHAAFAQRQFERAGVADRVEIRVGAALEVLPQLAEEVGPRSLDVVFIDAEKTEYPDYWTLVRPLVAVGGLVLADNVYGGGTWWIHDYEHPVRQAADRFNRLVAGDEHFEAVAVPLRQGVLIARRSL
ncbi:MAG: O-methyltransferase [Planctomycetota bacterium]|jgi:predicted O-methyltransferase YrrM